MKNNRYKYTPEQIDELADGEIFVFGSNPWGVHNAGAARHATQRFGAIVGKGIGLQGSSYAIPTTYKDATHIKSHVDEFIAFAKENDNLIFLVTQIGCGIAGFKAEQIAPLFRDAIGVENIVMPKQFVQIISSKDTKTTILK